MKRVLLFLAGYLTMTGSMQASNLTWFDGQHPITYQLPSMVEPVVETALAMWKDDMRQVTGLTPVASQHATIKVISSNSLPADGFCISVKGGSIIIEGSNGRGMAYGLLELSRLAGISPWIWWGDVVPEKKNKLVIDKDYLSEQQPSVAYRGIFLNDEDWSLRPWSCKTLESDSEGHIGTATYKKIFQLLLRLRANTVWPAMHPGTTPFFQIPGAKAVADSCGIVIGTSHCEPLLRNNVGEWDVKTRGDFNYKTNRESVQHYWVERLKEVSSSKDNMFTIGMRGIHDGSMEGYRTMDEKLAGLQQVIDDQQVLIRQNIGKPEKQMQVFVPYKEVLQLYEAGLRIPDYVTLLWCDDNYGYMTRLSDVQEQRRQGGAGIYYHLSYWGRPHDYLWLTTTQPGLIYHELREAYDHMMRQLWIANVHDPKVAGYDLELFLDLAWNINCVSDSTLNDHLRAWLCRQFGEVAGQRIFPAMHEFYRLCGERRPEFMGWTQVELDKQRYERGLSPVTQVPITTEEASARLAAFQRIEAIERECRWLVRPELSDAWFAAIRYPLSASAAMSRKILSDSIKSHQAYEEILTLTQQYNEMNNGKWRHLMDAAPRRLPVFENVNATLADHHPSNSRTFRACDYTKATDRTKTIQMLGHSMNAVSIPKDGQLSYRFEVERDADYTVQAALIPTHPEDGNDLRFSISIDEQEPVVFSLKEPFRSEQWKENVLRGQALRDVHIHLVAGIHTLTIRALDNHIVVDEWILRMQSADKSIRHKVNFNAGWRLMVGDMADAAMPMFDDSSWKKVTLPFAFNGDEAFRKDIVDLTDTVCWYRKEFRVESSERRDKKFFIEFEGVRQGADFYLNGHHLGFSENGVMACGFDLTPYIIEGKNLIAVRCDNSWTYRSREYDSRYQWNDRNFNANYGGIPKNVWLHVKEKLYQTLPLFSNLGTTGTYIYATDFDIAHHKAVVHVESQIRNEDTKPRSFVLFANLSDADGNEVAHFNGERITMQPGETRTIKIQQAIEGLHFWSWGYGYLYTVHTLLKTDDGSIIDDVTIRTGFRKTKFGEGKIWLNDRVMMVHGYAQRTSNEWPGVGISVPAWISDYSNDLMVKSGANMVRWMHITPWKQDIESCDRVGLPQAMPAGDAEKDVEGPRWHQRTALMRDAIIYNRNNPSILFYESGNESISSEHMLEMKAIRDKYDPYGGRAIGSREMLDIDEAEYGGEMLYINKSKKHPMWAMEYCRDEGLRKYWDEKSYPYHKEGDGPLYRGKPATEYNHNMDEFAVEMVRRWYDYWRERPGTGTRVSSGGVKIVFSDTNTHHRGESNYRMSGVTDAMRIPKDAFFVHQVLWNGWVEPEEAKTYIIGHWNYVNDVQKPVYVVSTADSVELFLNGKSLGHGKQSYRYLFTFDNVKYEPGTLEAVGSDGSHNKLETAGEPYQQRLTTISNPEGTKADGADMVLFEVEVVDKQGHRCPLDDRMIHFELEGEGQWIGGIATRNNKAMQRHDDTNREGLLDAAATKNISDNYVGATELPVECGVNRVLIRTTTHAGKIQLTATADGVKPASATILTSSLGEHNQPSLTLKSRLGRGETPLSPSYREQAQGIEIASATAGYDSEHAVRSFDDNELSEWRNNGRLSTAWITYKLVRKVVIDDICLKLTGWRLRSYPLDIYAGNQLIWSGETERSLGYVHLTPTQRVQTDEITIRLRGAGKDEDAFGGIVEVAEPAAGELDLFKAANGGDTKNELRIVEIEFIERM